jgi:hypothetical protein
MVHPQGKGLFVSFFLMAGTMQAMELPPLDQRDAKTISAYIVRNQLGIDTGWRDLEKSLAALSIEELKILENEVENSRSRTFGEEAAWKKIMSRVLHSYHAAAHKKDSLKAQVAALQNKLEAYKVATGICTTTTVLFTIVGIVIFAKKLF